MSIPIFSASLKGSLVPEIAGNPRFVVSQRFSHGWTDPRGVFNPGSIDKGPPFGRVPVAIKDVLEIPLDILINLWRMKFPEGANNEQLEDDEFYHAVAYRLFHAQKLALNVNQDRAYVLEE